MEERRAAIQKLLKLAEVTVENGSSENEAAIARRRGEKLIARHGLQIHEVAAEERRLAEEEAVRLGRRSAPAQRPPAPPYPAGNPFGPFGQPGFATGTYATTGTVYVNGPGVTFVFASARALGEGRGSLRLRALLDALVLRLRAVGLAHPAQPGVGSLPSVRGGSRVRGALLGLGLLLLVGHLGLLRIAYVPKA